MKRLSYAVGILTTIILLQSPLVAAVSIQYGTYQMEWRVPASKAKIDDLSQCTFLKIRPSEAKNLLGLVSAVAMRASGDNMMLILDESNGTGKDYDTLYLARGAKYGSQVDLAKCIKIPLQNYGSVLRPPGKKAFETQARIGGEGSTVTKPIAIDARVVLKSDKTGKKRPMFAQVQLRGGWQGTIVTSIGNAEAELIDYNGNGVYNDFWTGGRNGDALQLRFATADEVSAKNRYCSEPETAIPLRPANLFEGKFYDIRVSALGDTVKIGPYAGPTGTLAIDAKNGFGEPTRVSSVALSGDDGAYFFGDDMGDYFMASTRTSEVDWSHLALPVGKYRLIAVEVESAAGSKMLDLGLDIESDLKIEQGQTKSVRAGGPITIRINPTSRVITLKRGETADLKVEITVAGRKAQLNSFDRNVMVKITNSRGRAIWGGPAQYG